MLSKQTLQADKPWVVPRFALSTNECTGKCVEDFSWFFSYCVNHSGDMTKNNKNPLGCECLYLKAELRIEKRFYKTNTM